MNAPVRITTTLRDATDEARRIANATGEKVWVQDANGKDIGDIFPNRGAQRSAVPIMFVRDTNDALSHIADGWNSPARCGAKPSWHETGWTFGASNTIFSGIGDAVCPDCQLAN